jgi:dipeptidyl aminopeptidase/acylaminoacyl peptidase
MRSSSPPRTSTTLIAILVILTLTALSGCGSVTGPAQEGVAIPPASSGPVTDLGPGVRPLSFGPGDKSSPRVSPSGERVAFVLDGYVVDKALYSQGFRPLITASDFGAEYAEWLPDGDLAISSPEGGTGGGDIEGTPAPSSLLGVRLKGGSQDSYSSVDRLAENVIVAGAAPGGGDIAAIVSASTDPGSTADATSSRLVLLQGSEKPMKVYLREIKGPVASLSVSPDGRLAVLASRRDTGRPNSRFEILTYRLSDGWVRRVARLPKDMDILGAPQWTQRGVYFVGGEVNRTAEGGEDPTTYTLYRIPEGSRGPEPVRGVGEDFVAASISVSPDGGRLAIIGRRNPGSPTNLYVLDLASDTLKAATTNESMEIKTNPRDLAWYPDGSSVVLVARGAFSGPELYDAPAKALSAAFYSLYEVRVG